MIFALNFVIRKTYICYNNMHWGLKLKRVFFCVIALILIQSIVLLLISCKSEDVVLSCDENGDFTVLVVSDPQCDNALQWDQAKKELQILVERAEPDFVLINGDMNSENKIPVDMWEHFISPLTQRGIYWATTNGNHDPYTDKYYKMYKSYDKCLNAKVSVADINYEPSRPMNYVIPIYSNNQKEIVFAVYGMDSGGLNKSGYEGLTTKQINWYENESNQLKMLNGGKPVTSILCMHIPLPQTIDMYYSIDGGGTASDMKSGGLYNVYGIVNEPNPGLQNYVCENGTMIANTYFYTTAINNDRGMFDKILKQGDVKAVIFGHDHQINLAGSYNGVVLGFAGKLSTGCYSDELCRGGRVIKFNEADPEKFTVSWLASLECCQDQPEIYSDGSLAQQ